MKKETRERLGKLSIQDTWILIPVIQIHHGPQLFLYTVLWSDTNCTPKQFPFNSVTALISLRLTLHFVVQNMDIQSF